MQQHTGEHIVSGIVHAQFGYDNVGFHIGAQDVTVDFFRSAHRCGVGRCGTRCQLGDMAERARDDSLARALRSWRS